MDKIKDILISIPMKFKEILASSRASFSDEQGLKLDKIATYVGIFVITFLLPIIFISVTTAFGYGNMSDGICLGVLISGYVISGLLITFKMWTSGFKRR